MHYLIQFGSPLPEKTQVVNRRTLEAVTELQFKQATCPSLGGLLG